jgi:hypothetical protein
MAEHDRPGRRKWQFGISTQSAGIRAQGAAGSVHTESETLMSYGGRTVTNTPIPLLSAKVAFRTQSLSAPASVDAIQTERSWPEASESAKDRLTDVPASQPKRRGCAGSAHCGGHKDCGELAGKSYASSYLPVVPRDVEV